ncbi:MAG: hypothetical protein U0903_03350 [Planctomycetales bacterium]
MVKRPPSRKKAEDLSTREEWPKTETAPFRKSLLAWYRKNGRPLPWRQTHDPYRIWISEIMLQQTTVVAVIPYFERFLKRFPHARGTRRRGRTGGTAAVGRTRLLQPGDETC